MQVLNVDKLVTLSTNGKEPVDAKNHLLVPQHFGGTGSFRWLICGPAGKGKTNLVVSCLMQGQIKFDHLYLYARDPTQPKYQLLQKWLNTMQDELAKEGIECGPIYTVISDPEKVIPVDELNKEILNLAIFDDMILEKNQELIVEYFVRGRHKNVDCIYITQNYYSKDKFIQNIKKNCNYVACFGVTSQAQLVQLAKDLSFHTSFKEFKEMLDKATEGDNDFMFIDTRTNIPLMRIRKGFDGIWNADIHAFEPIGDLIVANKII